MDFAKLAKNIEAEIIRIRREIHAYPELCNEEFKTSAKIKEELAEIGIDDVANVTETGLVADIRVGDDLQFIAFRADIDALPITEDTGVDYASRNPGFMHACGHDAHTAMVLGAARVISENRDALKQNVRFIFQPAEEFPPGGAARMIEGGCLDGVSEIFGLHVDSSLQAGSLAAREGPAMAESYSIVITFTGVGGHGARPHETSDLLFTVIRALSALEAIPCRRINPIEPSVLSLCSIHGGSAYNILPEKIEVEGTLRTISEETRNRFIVLIQEILEGVCSPVGVEYELKCPDTYPVTINHPKSVRRVAEITEMLFGSDSSLQVAQLRMIAEDFSRYLQHVPGAFIFLGTAGETPGSRESLHSSRFNVEESALWKGTALMAALAFSASVS